MTPLRTIVVRARLERSKKGKRLRVRCEADGRAVRCGKGWRHSLTGPVTVQARDMGTHWSAV